MKGDLHRVGYWWVEYRAERHIDKWTACWVRSDGSIADKECWCGITAKWTARRMARLAKRGIGQVATVAEGYE